MYQALYRKWRPRVFSDVAGQDAVTGTLLGELRAGRLSHAYLFTGSRGTGKTTCAKILAKAVNCLNPVNGDPCNECEICRGIDSGAILDVVEIDAASNNSVDNVRDLREEANFTPVSCKYRVYIIDEVHMLSSGAFNALLKTLEEPPAHVLFILATTEVHKLPTTILSRCQRFDFRRIPPEDIVARLGVVAKAEGIELEPDAAMMIARLSDGALRDALSILDQCAGYGKAVDIQVVTGAAGLLGRDYLFDMSDAVKNHDTAAALELLDTLHKSSCDMERLANELINHFRNIMIAKAVSSPQELIVCTPDELERIKAAAKGFTYEEIIYALGLLGGTPEKLRRVQNQRAEMELTLITLCKPELKADMASALARIARLESAMKTGAPVSSPEPERRTVKPEVIPEVKTSAPEPEISREIKPDVREVQPEEPEPDIAIAAEPEPEILPEVVSGPEPSGESTPMLEWTDVISAIGGINKPLAASLMRSEASVRGNSVVIKPVNDAFEALFEIGANSQVVSDAVLRVTGRKLKPEIYKKSVSGKQQDDTGDVLDSFMRRLQGRGIEFTVED
ncbi:MAG: DNA polymerase III subunit gamma/tau [Clostridiales bacterium]|nr:DNA polymerase III subunit gamma/tau [Clostridiales bacterium]